jgi:hypothetical protein
MSGRPDLDEFLSALDGFLESKTASLPHAHDPTYLRFLEIFCRSVGSAEGHLLKFQHAKGLQSIVSFGIPENFEKELNEALEKPHREPTPLDAAFKDQEVVAVVEVKRGAGIPTWLMEILNKYGFKSMIAVPLIGQSRPVGILCAYYRDVCLFDKGTLDRLMTVGRMVGAATENAQGAGRVEIAGPNEKVADDYLKLLVNQPITKINIFETLVRLIARALTPAGLLCGPVRMVERDMVLTIEEGSGIPMNAISQRFAVPPILARQLIVGHTGKIDPVAPEEWGAMRPLLPSKGVDILCQPIAWEKQSHAAILLWRSNKKPFAPDEEALLSRLGGITALALRSS